MSRAFVRMFVCFVLLFLLAANLASVAFAQEASTVEAGSQLTPFFTAGNLVVSVEGNGVVGGSGNYGDNQAAPLTLFQFQLNGSNPVGSAATYVDSLVFPQAASGANYPVSGEYGSSSEGRINVAGTGQYLTIMGYGVNAAAFNANPTVYGPADAGALAQSGSLTGQSYTAVPRVVTLVDPYGNVNSSTGLFNIFNGNNPRSTYTADGTHIYVSGQGASGDTTSGVFYTTLGSSSSTAITGNDSGSGVSQDTRDVQIYNNTLFVSMDSKSGSYNRSYIGTLGDPPATSVFTCTGVGAGCPTGDGTIGPALMSGFGNTGGTGKVTITSGTNSNGNNLNAGLAINISPENFFFASPSVLYVADSGSPKNTSNGPDAVCTTDGGTATVGDGGLQKWVNSQSNGTGTWSLAYTLYKGLNLVINAACDPHNADGTTGLIGLTGVVSGSSVNLYATNYTIADLDPTYVYGITDTLSFTTASQASSETFTQLAAAPADSNFKGIAFAPTLPAGSATITSSPSGLTFTSGGTGCAPGTYTTPVTLIWTPGNSCQLSVVSLQTANGAQYTFSQWQDGTTGTTDHVTAPTTSAVYTASFTTTTSLAVTSVNPASETYGQDAPTTITAVLSWNGNGPAPTASDVSIGGNGHGLYGSTSCGAPSGNSLTCTATYTPSTADVDGSYTMTATFSGDSNYTGSSSPQTNNFTISSASSSTSIGCAPNPSSYGQSVTCTATISGQNGAVRGQVKQRVVTGTVTWSANTGCGTTSVTSGNPGTATCTTSSLAGGSDTVTATYSGDSNHSGSAGSFTQTVSPASTSIAVTSVSPAAEDYASTAAVTITAQLSWSGSGATPTAANVSIGGNSTGTYGATSCGAPSGTTLTCTATLTPSGTDLPGNYTQTAAFSGDSNYSASSSPQTNNFAINSASATTVVTSSGSPSAYGQPVTLTATINGENGNFKRKVKQHVITGTVAWTSNGVTIAGCGSTSVSSGNPGVATCTTSGLAVGTDSITATYSGDGNHGGSAGSFSQSVTQGSTSIAVSVSPAAEDYGNNATVAITAVLSWSGSGSAPTASDVAISGNGSGSYGATSCGTPSGTTLTCTATYTPNNDLTGAYTETAAFSGDTNYSASSSTQTNNFTINIATSTTSVTSTPNPSTYAQSVTFTASVAGEFNFAKGKTTRRGVKQHDITGTVTWSANTGCGTTAVTSGNPGTATCTTSRASSLEVGTDTVTATYSGDSNHSGSTGSVNQVVQGGIATTIDVTNVSPAAEDFAANSPVTITAVLSWTGHGVAPTASDVTISGNGNGTYGATTCAARVHETISCQATYTPTNADLAGTYTETATFSGDTNYSASTSPETNNFTINQATSTTGVTSSPNPSVYATPVTFTATINGENGNVKGRVKRHDVTGTVTWSANTGCGTTAVTSGNPGTATCTTSSLQGGTDAISATYSGDSNHGESSGTLSGGQVVTPASQTVAFTSNPPANEVYNGTFTVAASASSGLAVTYGSSGTCSNSNATYTMTSGTGSCTVTISQAGNNDYSAATPVSKTVNATLASQTITVVTPAPATATLSSHFTVVATAPSGNVAYGSSGGCTNAAGTYTMASSGHVACNETISAAATSNYSAAPTVTESTTVAAAIAPTVTFTGAPMSANYQSIFNVATTTNAGVSATITAAGSCSISGNTVTMTSGTGMCTMTASWPATDVYKAATATQHTTAEKIAPTVTFTGAPATEPYLSSFTVATTQNSGVMPTIAATQSASACTVSGNTVTMKSGSATCTVKASWAANANYLATSATQTTTGTPLATTTTITSAVPGTNPLKVEVYFTVSNGANTVAGDVTVKASPGGETCTGTVASGKCLLTFTAAGPQSLTAVYAGNSDNGTSTSAPHSITVQ